MFDLFASFVNQLGNLYIELIDQLYSEELRKVHLLLLFFQLLQKLHQIMLKDQLFSKGMVIQFLQEVE